MLPQRPIQFQGYAHLHPYSKLYPGMPLPVPHQYVDVQLKPSQIPATKSDPEMEAKVDRLYFFDEQHDQTVQAHMKKMYDKKSRPQFWPGYQGTLASIVDKLFGRDPQRVLNIKTYTIPEPVDRAATELAQAAAKIWRDSARDSVLPTKLVKFETVLSGKIKQEILTARCNILQDLIGEDGQPIDNGPQTATSFFIAVDCHPDEILQESTEAAGFDSSSGVFPTKRMMSINIMDGSVYTDLHDKKRAGENREVLYQLPDYMQNVIVTPSELEEAQKIHEDYRACHK